jgi:hypothetical protein
MSKYLSTCVCALIPFCLNIPSAYAHAIVGDRIFPATLTIDDPGVNDEPNLPQIGRSNDGGTWTTTVTSEFDKRLTEDWGVSANANWQDAKGISGFNNYDVGTKYVFLKNPEHELMLSSELIWEIGNSGAKRIASNFSTLTPSLLFGKGMGDLPDSLNVLKPFALTGTLGYAVPTQNFSTDPDTGDKTRNPQAVQWGFTMQYSVPYLQQHVKDMGIPAPFSTAIPIVEFALQTPTGGDQSGKTTGMINPGVIFMGQEEQIGLEAQIPLNHASGNGIGFLVQTHFYLDNIFPATIGRPIW